MQTFASILLILLASVEAARGHSSKSEKLEISSMSFEFIDAKSGKRSKSAKSIKSRRFLVDQSARTLHSSSESSMSFVGLFSSKSGKSEGAASGSGKAGKAESDVGSSGKSGKSKAAKVRRFLDVNSSEERSRRFLDVDSSEDSFESMSVELTFSSAKSQKSHSGAAKSFKAVSSEASSSDETHASAKSSKTWSSETATSGDEEELAVEATGKSNKGGKSFQTNIFLRSNDPRDSEDIGLLKSQSYIEYTRAQVPESATGPSEEPSGAMEFGPAASLFTIALIAATSAVFV